MAVLEPRITGRAFVARELWLGAAVVPGVALVVGGVPSGMLAGFVVGTLSALLVAVFGAFNKRLVDRADPLTVTCLELGAGRSEEHTSELQSLMRISYAVFCLKKKINEK